MGSLKCELDTRMNVRYNLRARNDIGTRHAVGDVVCVSSDSHGGGDCPLAPLLRGSCVCSLLVFYWLLRCVATWEDLFKNGKFQDS